MNDKEKSFAFGMLTNIYGVVATSLLPFVVRTVLIKKIGLDYAGVNGLFSSIMQVLNVVDFGAIPLFSTFLYGPVAKKDYATINAYLRYFRRIFQQIGIIILTIGILSVFVLPYLIKNKEYPKDINIYIVYFVYIIHAACSYLFYGDKYALYLASLKGYIYSLMVNTSLLFTYVMQIACILIVKNFHLYTVLLLFSDLFIIIVISYRKNIDFPNLEYIGNVSDEFALEFKNKAFAMFLSKMRIISRNSIDSIIISAYMGLSVLAKYQNYYQIVVLLISLIAMFISVVVPILGKGYVTESRESNYGVISLITYISNAFATIVASFLVCCIQTFIGVWVGIENIMPFSIAISISIYFYALVISNVVVMLRESTGIWVEGKYISVLETILNLVLNILFVKMWGVIGVIVASIGTVLFINIPLELHCIFKRFYYEKYKTYIIRLIIYVIEALVIVIITYRIVESNIESFIGKLLLSAFIPMVLFLIFNINNTETKETIRHIIRYTKHRI